MPKQKKTVLVVEDSPVTQKMLEKVLTNDGYNVLAAWDGNQCLELTKKQLPDAILMDVLFPNCDGKEIAVQLKANPATAKIPILFITNTLDVKKDKGGEYFDIEGHVCRAFAKPLHNQKLLSALRKEINRSVHGGKLPKDVNVVKVAVKPKKN